MLENVFLSSFKFKLLTVLSNRLPKFSLMVFVLTMLAVKNDYIWPPPSLVVAMASDQDSDIDTTVLMRHTLLSRFE